jgi:predicted dehydrogenase
VNNIQTERFPKVEDNSVLVLTYKNGVGLFEGSWDLPRSFQDLEVFGREGSLYMTRNGVELRKGRRDVSEITPAPLPPERDDPLRYMAHVVTSGQPVDNIMALDINVEVVEMLDAAKESIKTGRAVNIPAR